MLTELREGIAADLVAAGVRAVEYTSSALTPPVAAVVPAQPYLSWGDEGLTFGRDVRVRVDVLLISHETGSGKTDASLVDRLIESAVSALSERGPVRVSRPGIFTYNGTRYMGAVLSLEHDTAEPTAPAPEE